MNRKPRRLKDKDYVLTKHGMLFNVTGYEHLDSHYFASLKYISGKKWTAGYSAAKQFLGERHPEYVGQFIQVPVSKIERCYFPQHRWQELCQTEQRQPDILSPLHRDALALGSAIQTALGIPSSSLGITDSLLWGDGHATSDIDLVVVGLEHVAKIMRHGRLLYDAEDFQRPDPAVMTSPYGLAVEDWPGLLRRKMHMGCFRGRLFSVRGVLDDHELKQRKLSSIPANSVYPNSAEFAQQSIEFDVVDVSESLLFPAVYRNEIGDELIDYSVVYEGVFRPGDRVSCDCEVETVQRFGKQIRRCTMIGSATIQA